MPQWFDRMIGRQSPFAKQLAAYAPYRAPFAGPAALWSLEQARANLEHLLAHREQRLQTLAALLAEYGIDIGRPLAGGEFQPMLDALHKWVNKHWPAVYERAIATEEVWSRSSRDGQEIIYSLVFDIGLLLGELVVRRRPRYAWALNLDANDKRDGMPSHNRAVVLLPATGEMPAPVICDFEIWVAWRYWNPDTVSARVVNNWAQAVDDAIQGLHEAASWLAPPPLSDRGKHTGVRADRRARLEAKHGAGSPENSPISADKGVLFSPLDQAGRLLRQVTGVEARRFSTRDFGRERYLRARSVLVPDDKAEELLGALRPRLPKGLIAFVGVRRSHAYPTPNGVELVIGQGDDQFEILRVAGTDSVNHDLTTEDLVRELQSWDAEFGIDIWQAETDVVQISLKAVPQDVRQFVTRLRAFCPNVVDSNGDDAAASLARDITERRELLLWWD
jgi:hypothetical protein